MLAAMVAAQQVEIAELHLKLEDHSRRPSGKRGSRCASRLLQLKERIRVVERLTHGLENDMTRCAECTVRMRKRITALENALKRVDAVRGDSTI